MSVSMGEVHHDASNNNGCERSHCTYPKECLFLSALLIVINIQPYIAKLNEENIFSWCLFVWEKDLFEKLFFKKKNPI